MKRHHDKSRGKGHHWDERFWLGKIPDLFGDPPPVARKPSTSGQKRRKGQQTRGAQLGATRSGAKALDKAALARYIEDEWEQQGVPEYFREVYRETLLEFNFFHTEVVMKKELEDLMSGESILLRALEAVNVREESLKDIREMNSYLEKAEGWLGLPQAVEESQDLLQGYRIATLGAVEWICKWKEFIKWLNKLNNGVKPSKKVAFMWHNQNYLTKMRTDANFLYSSELAAAYEIVQNDPLLLTAESEDAPVSLAIKSEFARRLDEAHRILFKGQRIQKSQSVPQHRQPRDQIRKAAKEIATDILDRELARTVEECARQAYAEALSDPLLVSPFIYETLLDDAVLKTFIEECDEQTSEEIANEFIDESIRPIVQETVESLALEDTNAMTQMMLDQLFPLEDVVEIARTVYLEACAVEISDQLCSDLFDEVVSAFENEVVLEIVSQEAQSVTEAIAEILLYDVLHHAEHIEVTEIAREIYTHACTKEISAEIYEMIANEALTAVEQETASAALEEERAATEKVLEAQRAADEEALEAQRAADEEALEAQRAAAEEALEAQRAAAEEALEAERAAAEKERAAKELAASEAETLAQLLAEDLLPMEDVTALVRKVYSKACTIEIAEQVCEALFLEVTTSIETEVALTIVNQQDSELLNSLWEDLLFHCAEEVAQDIVNEIEAKREAEAKAKNLQHHQLAEGFFRQLLEIVINETNLDALAEKYLSKVIFRRRTLSKDGQEQARLAAKEFELDNEAIAKDLAADLIEDFLDADWVSGLVDFIYEHEFVRSKTLPGITIYPEDDAMELFTPHIHSPASYSVISSAAERQSETLFAVATDFSSVKGVEFEPVRAPLSALPIEMAEYLAIVPADIASVLLPEAVLEDTCLEGNDSSWFYGVLDGKVVGMLIYSVEPTSLYQRKLEVLHISCLNFHCFAEFITEACNFLWRVDSCQEIRVRLYSPATSDINRAIKGIFNTLKFRWKTEQLLTDGKLTVMGIGRPNQQPTALMRPPLSVSVMSSLATSNESLTAEPDEESMASVGVRQSLLAAVLGFFGQLTKGDMKIGENRGHRLQSDLDRVLQRVKQTNRFDLPYTETAVDLPTSRAGVSLDMNWVGCTHITRNISHVQYKYLRLRSARLEHLETESQHLYLLPTSAEGITALFIKGECQRLWLDLRKQNLDLAEWVTSLRSIAWESEEECTALLAPVFSVEIEAPVPWMLGYHIPGQVEDKPSVYVSEASQKVEVSMTAQDQCAGAFLGDSIREQVIEEDFVFGLLHSGADRDLGVPILTVLVQRKDWQLAHK